MSDHFHTFQLFSLLGFEAFDLIADILANRRVIKEPSGFDLLTVEQEDTFDIYSDETAPSLPHFKQERAPIVATQVMAAYSYFVLC